MPLFGRRLRARCALLTGIISAGANGWEVSWVGDGAGCREPPGLVAASLSEAAEQSTALALALFAAGELAPEAELQFAIYPWDYGKSAPIFDVDGSQGSFTASNMFDEAAAPVRGATLEELVTHVGMQPGGDAAMLRWSRALAGLSAGVPD
jgi:hypothetical protein